MTERSWPREDSGAARSEDAPELRVKELEEELRRVRGALVSGLNQLLDLKDLHTGSHSTRLAEWGARLAIDVGLDEDYQRNVEVACILHDVGKIGIPDSILLKKGALTPEERTVMQKHPEYSWAILRLFPGFELASLFALHHHEHFGGGGYPADLARNEIPMGARIVAIVDAFDAMVSARSYRPPLSLDVAIQRLQKGSEIQFDPTIVEPFMALARSDFEEIEQLTAPIASPLAI